MYHWGSQCFLSPVESKSLGDLCKTKHIIQVPNCVRIVNCIAKLENGNSFSNLCNRRFVADIHVYNIVNRKLNHGGCRPIRRQCTCMSVMEG